MTDNNPLQPIPEGWKFERDGKRIGGKVSYYICAKTQQHFDTYDDMMRYVNYSRQEALPVYIKEMDFRLTKRREGLIALDKFFKEKYAKAMADMNAENPESKKEEGSSNTAKPESRKEGLSKELSGSQEYPYEEPMDSEADNPPYDSNLEQDSKPFSIADFVANEAASSKALK